MNKKEVKIQKYKKNYKIFYKKKKKNTNFFTIDIK